MMYKAFLVKYAEIGIKGKNRHLFEKALCVQMEHALAPVDGISRSPVRWDESMSTPKETLITRRCRCADKSFRYRRDLPGCHFRGHRL